MPELGAGGIGSGARARIGAAPGACRAAGALLLPLAWPFAAGGCAGDRSLVEPGVLRRDSAGVEIVENRAPAWSRGTGWTIAPEPAVQIGRREGSEEEMLHGVVAARHAGDSVLIAERTRLRLFDGAGNFRWRLGGAGDGPGEFRVIHSFLRCGDRILVTDVLQPRLTLLEPGGGAQTYPLPTPDAPGRARPLRLLSCTEAGVIGSLPAGGAGPGAAPGVQRAPQALVAWTERGRLDTLLTYPGTEVLDGLLVPFGRTTLLDARDSLIHTADTGEPSVRTWTADGSLRRIVRLDRTAPAVTAADRERIRAQYLQGVPASIAAEITPRLDAAPLHATMPHFSELRAAPDGTLWLRAYQPFRDEEVSTWTVIDPIGVWLGDVALPPRFTIHEFGTTTVLGVWRDEFDVEFVRRYEIRR